VKISKRDFIKLVGGVGAAARVTRGCTGPLEELDHPGANAVMPTEVSLKPSPVDTSQVVSRLFDLYEICDVREWDRFTLDEGRPLLSEFGMFSVGQFQRCPYSGRIKGREDTSLVVGGRFPPPETMWIKRIHFFLREPSLAVMRAATEYNWKLWIGCKCYAAGNLLSSLTTSRSGWPHVNHSAFQFPATRGLLIPHSFHFNLSFETGPESRIFPVAEGSPFDLQVELEGVRVRGVQ